MKMQKKFALALVGACGLAASAQAQVYSNTTPTPIPDTPTVVSTITVSGFTGTVSDLNLIVNMDHTFDGDLDYILIPPGGTGVQYLHLSTDNGSTGDNFRYTRFDDSAASVITAGTAPFCGDFRPEGTALTSAMWAAAAPWALASLGAPVANLAAFNGIDPNGTWTLVIDDDAGGDTGTLRYWSLEFNNVSDTIVNAPIVNNATATAAAGGTATISVVATGPCRAGGSAVDGVTVDASVFGAGTVTLTGPGTGNTWTGSIAVPSGTVPGPYALPATATLGALTASGTVTVNVLPPAPGCIPGVASASFSGMISTVAASTAIPPAPQAGSDTTNTIVQSTQTASGTASALRVSGRLVGSSFNLEARIRVVSPAGNAYLLQPFTTTPSTNPRDLTSLTFPFPTAETIAGDWYFETFESFNDTGRDGTWSSICFTFANPPVGTPTTPVTAFQGAALPGFSSNLELSVAVTGGAGPYTVTVDASSAGGSTVTLTDPDMNGTYTASVPAAGLNIGNFTLPFSVVDSASESFAGTIAARVRRGVTDLGTVSSTNEGTLIDNAEIAVGEARWYKLTLCNEVSGTEFFDLTATGTFGASADTEFGIYRADGTLVASDDDDGVLAGSALSFGAGSGATQGGTGTTDGTPVVANGRDGAVLAAGEYYLVLGQFNTDFLTTGFGVNTFGAAAGTMSVVFDSSAVCGPVCDSIDFNNDTSSFDPQDIEAFLSVYAEGDCVPATATCNDIDFNNDTSVFDPCDISSFLTVYAEGPCTPCGE